MKGIQFGNYHSWKDFSLILNSKSIGSAEPKTASVEIPGTDGEKDLTEYFGETKYKNRKLSFDFTTIIPKNEFLDLFSTIQNALQGQKIRIIIDDDPDFYYVGRCTVSPWKANKNIGTITVDCDCEPWKYRHRITVRKIPSGEYTTILSNMRKSVVPTFITNGASQITFNGTTYNVGIGSYKIPEIVLREGNNLISFNGAEMNVEYQEGGL